MTTFIYRASYRQVLASPQARGYCWQLPEVLELRAQVEAAAAEVQRTRFDLRSYRLGERQFDDTRSGELDLATSQSQARHERADSLRQSSLKS
jgi:hypothetical protein